MAFLRMCLQETRAHAHNDSDLATLCYIGSSGHWPHALTTASGAVQLHFRPGHMGRVDKRADQRIVLAAGQMDDVE